MLALCHYLSFSLIIASTQAASLTFSQASSSTVANRLLGSTFDLGSVTSIGNAEQIGYFTGGSAAGFGIDSGIVLSTGTLTGSNDSEPSSDPENPNIDADIPDSQDSASISTSIKAKDGNTHASTTFGAVFCTCEDVSDVNFQERAQISINGNVIYARSKGFNDTRPTAPFGFAVDNAASFSGGQCMCSDVETFSLPRSQTADAIKIVVADTSDGLFNSWIFLGIVGYADQALATATQTQIISATSVITATSTISTQVVLSTALQTITTTQMATLAPSTVTVTAATVTSTAINPACTDYLVQFEAKCCPTLLLRKVAPIENRRELQARQQAITAGTSTVATITASITSTVAATTTLNEVFTTSSATTQIITETTTTTLAAPTATETVTPILTKSVCKRILVPKYKCPKNKNVKAVLALERDFLNSYAKRPKMTWRTLQVNCDSNSQQYAYP